MVCPGEPPVVRLAALSVAPGGVVSTLPFPSSTTSSTFQPISFCDCPEAMPQSSRTDGLPATQDGRLYCTAVQELSRRLRVVDQTSVHVVPLVDTWIEAISPVRSRSHRWNRKVTLPTPEQS